jgi:hypothetical protein
MTGPTPSTETALDHRATPGRRQPAADRAPAQPGGTGIAWQLAASATVILLTLMLVAVVVHVAAPAIARRLLAFAFPTRPPGLRAAPGILIANLRLAAAPLAGALLLRLADRGGRVPDPERALLDVILAGVVVLNVLIVGAGFGAYGARMVRYTLPHGPIELTGYCCALTVYLSARAGRPGAHSALALTGAALMLLGVAAMLEATCSPV